jgi:hypothetical protein
MFVILSLLISLPTNVSATIGWQFEPSIKITHITSLPESIVIVTDDGIIKLFDPQTHELKKRLQFPETTYKKGHYKPSITNAIHDKNTLFIQTNQYFAEAKIFRLNQDGSIEKLISLPMNSRLITSDSDYYYFIESQSIADTDNTKITYLTNSFKYDKNFKIKTDNHFESYPDLVIVDYFEDDVYSWYVLCKAKNIKPAGQDIGNYYFKGEILIISKEKNTARIKEIILHNDDLDWIQLPVNSDKNNIWFFTRVGLNYSDTKLTRLDKESGEIASRIYNERLFPIVNNESEIKSDYFGAIDNNFGLNVNTLYLINKKNLNITAHNIDLPSDITKIHRRSGSFGSLASYADEKYFYIGLLKHKDLTPYLLKISRDDMSYEISQVTQTLGESISMFTTGIFNIITSPLRIIFRPH